MNVVYISVIIPEIKEEGKLVRFCSSLFSSQVNAELLICGKISEETASALGKDYGDKIKVFAPGAVSKAVENAAGAYIMFADDSIVFADEALETLIVRGKGEPCVCNAAYIDCGGSVKLMKSGFGINDAAAESISCIYFFRKSVIAQNGLYLTGCDSLAVRILAADYMRFERFTAVDEVLMYTDRKIKPEAVSDVQTVKDYAPVFSQTGDAVSTMFFLNAVFTAAADNMNSDVFEMLKAVAECFNENTAILCWIEARFGIDTAVLLDGSSDYSLFKADSRELHYKEVCLPMNKNDVIMNFYSGKFGVDVLKKCFGAWLYYKLYRGKDGIVKKLGCKLCRKLLGGDFDV